MTHFRALWPHRDTCQFIQQFYNDDVVRYSGSDWCLKFLAKVTGKQSETRAR